MISDTFTAVVTSHKNEKGLRHILGNLMYQTRPPDETIVLYSGGPYDVMRLLEDFPEVSFGERKDKEDWGHDKRAEGIGLARGEWMGFFNDDDDYNLGYIERMMMRAGPGVDAVYCWWDPHGKHGCNFQLGSSTSGNYIVRTWLAKQIGYPWRNYEADGHFIDEIAKEAREIQCVPEILYTWNDPSNQRGE